MDAHDHDSSSEDSTSLSPERKQYIEYCIRVIAAIAEIDDCIRGRRPCISSTPLGDEWVAGWEGSAHDSRIFARALTDKKLNFPHPPQGKYYLIDAEYPQKTGYLKPYPDARYNLTDYARGSLPIQGMHERFNEAHSSLRSVIDRTFGVWKKKWPILSNMPQYNFKTQRSIVVATMALHNLIRKHPSQCDPEFNACDVDDSFIILPEVDDTSADEDDTSTDDDIETFMFDAESVDHMSEIRDNIAEKLYNAREEKLKEEGTA